jgi:Flp pilus assembly protein TadD
MSHYRESQTRIDEAEAALREGDEARARASYREAARLQRAFIDSVPEDRVRTRSIYGLSVATLLYRAGDLWDAERLAHQLLAEPRIEPHSANQLRALLNRICRSELARASLGSPSA